MSARFNRAAQRSGAALSELFRVCFCIAAFLLFAPLALRYAARGDWIGAAFALICGLGAGALLAPRDD